MTASEPVAVHTTAKGIKVYVRRGGKKEWDFIVTHDRPGGETHQVLHRDFVCDLYRKRQAAPEASDGLVGHLLDIINRAQGVTSFPPALVYFSREHVKNLLDSGLPSTVGYDLELLLVLFELVQIQEETNYPHGWLPTKLYETIRDSPDDLNEIARLTEWRSGKRQATLIVELREIVGS